MENTDLDKKEEVGKIEELKFKLDWKIKNQLIQLINNFSEFLLIDSKIILNNEKELIRKKNDLTKILTNLELKLNKSNLENIIKSTTGQLITFIDNKFRLKIIDILIRNECFAINYRNQFDEDDKKKLINENKDLVIKLMNLSFEFLDDNLINKKRKLEDDDETESEGNFYSLIYLFIYLLLILIIFKYR